MSERSIALLVASVQRRTTSRLDAHRLVARAIEAMSLDPHTELVLRDAAYRRIFPEYAHRLASDEPATGGAKHA